ncbi:MAG: GAF domain-containing protein [Rhodospirillales bacterium]|nr:GAF domain-containing protein [Rhodospirillales bacterium]
MPADHLPRRLLARLRELMARGAAPLADVAALVAREMVAEVASVYVCRPGDILELAATFGLNPGAVGRTRLRVGEGIVGLCAAAAEVMNLPDAQNHPGFAYRPETGEEPYTSMLAVPVRRAGRTLGVLSVQNRAPRRYADDEVEELETVAMLLAELLAGSGAEAGSPDGIGGAVPRLLSGLSLSPGLVLGSVVMAGGFRLRGRLLADDPDAELARLEAASQRMQRQLDELFDGRIPDDAIEATASRDVLEAYRLVAADAGWLRRAAEVIQSGLSAEAAVQRVAGELHDRMRRITDPYLRERLADVEDLAGRLLAELAGSEGPPLLPGAILVARRLGPAELLDWHSRGIAGVVIEEASPAGHAAILARALGLPAIGGLRGALAAAASGEEAILDADQGTLVLRPDTEMREIYGRAIATRAALAAGQAGQRTRACVTADGTRVRLMLNLGLPLELEQLTHTGADGVGLFRTEIAMLARGVIPDVAEQATFYARVLDAAGDRPVVFRTLDLGGDKLMPGTEAPEEANPAMGWRSLRVGLDRPAVLRRQLRALLLGAGGRPLSVMFPMVATVAEFRAARALLEAEARRMRPAPDRLCVGTMLEVPALLWQLGPLLEEADFISIGSNDLMQFLFAADRGSPALAGRYDLISPPVFDLLEQVRAAAAAARGGQGVPVSLCGEAAGRPLEAMVLAGLGVTTLSMPAFGLPTVKALLSGVDLPALREVLATLRRTADGAASLREPILAWARERGLDA